MKLTKEVLFLMDIFYDYVKRKKLMKNFTPQDLLTCCHDLSDSEREWLESFDHLWFFVTDKQAYEIIRDNTSWTWVFPEDVKYRH